MFTSYSYNMEEYWDSFDLPILFNKTSNTALLAVKAHTIVSAALAMIIKPPSMISETAALTGTFVLGDSADTDGFLKEFSFIGQPVGTLIGNDEDEVGDYFLVNQLGAQVADTQESADKEYGRLPPSWERMGKYYLNNGTIIATATLSSIPDTEGKIRFWVKMMKLVRED